MATIGQALTAPESGWRRYDDTDSRIKYDGAFSLSGVSGSFYNSYTHLILSGTAVLDIQNSFILIKFYGTKFRFISHKHSEYTQDLRFDIDGVNAGSISLNGTTVYKALLFEKIDLPLGVHTVKIYCGDGVRYSIDAIDIDSSGYLLHPILNQVSSLSNMQIGDCIPFKYTASTSGAAGTISELGTCTADEIPVIGSATPNGLGYFIKVDKGLLIADRVIQHSISWDTLNAAKYIQNNPYDTDKLIRSLTGGCAYVGADGNKTLTNANLGAWPTNNEYDSYITKSTLNGKITAGDANIWNLNNLYSWCQDTSVTGSFADGLGNTATINNTCRTVRGYINRDKWIGLSSAYSNTVSATMGFRPVLQYPEDPKCTNVWY